MPKFNWLGLAGIICTILCGCSPFEWPSYRHDQFRNANLPGLTPISSPPSVQNLDVRWTFQPTNDEAENFRASPIIFNGSVYIGSTSGYFYALSSGDGTLFWQFPRAGSPLLGSCREFGRYGIQSSATSARIGGEDAVVFGAPDPDAESGLGSARLFALNALTGAEIWRSDVVAHVNGCNSGSFSELHERIAYSSPLVAFNKVYVGIHDTRDDPIQRGKVVAVDLSSGHIVPTFSFVSTPTLGGAAWNAPATDGTDIYFTTGNTRCTILGPPPTCQPEPSPNYGLSLVRVQRDTGKVIWNFQPVPFALDNDPDWAAGATVMFASCGELLTSVQKDGWVYAVDANDGSCKWQFPPMHNPNCIFPSNDSHPHGDDGYRQPVAVWGDVLIVKAGGEDLASKNVSGGYTRLHALNACTDDAHRVRWILDVPSISHTGDPRGMQYQLGAPTVTRGIIYVTTDLGHVVAIADPSVVPAAGYRCTSVDFGPPSPTWQSDCTAAGYSIVPVPRVLADIALPDGRNAVALRSEPALAYDRIFVGTDGGAIGGHVYALEPRYPPPNPIPLPRVEAK